MKVNFCKAVDATIINDPPVVFRSSPVHTSSASTTLKNSLRKAENEFWEQIDGYISGGSGWVLDSIVELDLVIFTFDPLRASSYIKLPKRYRNQTVGLLNIQNNDNKCFLYCFIANSYTPRDHPYRVSHYKNVQHGLDLTGCTWSMRIDKINDFENKNSMSINVFRLNAKKDKIVPVRTSSVDMRT